MPLLADPFTVTAPFQAGFCHGTALWATEAAVTVGPVADDAEDVRTERRIDAMDANRTDDDTVPEHDPDGTPWAA